MNRWLSVPPLTILAPPEAISVGHGGGVADHLGGVLAELGRRRLGEPDGPGGDLVVERPALGVGEDALVDGLGELLLAEDEAAPGPRIALWVVPVTTSANGTGSGWAPPAISPMM